MIYAPGMRLEDHLYCFYRALSEIGARAYVSLARLMCCFVRCWFVAWRVMEWFSWGLVLPFDLFFRVLEGRW